MTYPNDLPTPYTARDTPSTEAARTTAQVRCPSCGSYVPSTAQGWTRRMERCQNADGSESNTTRLVPYTTCQGCGRGEAILML